MSRETRVEEVSDSDPDEMDPADFDPTPLPANHLISPANIPSSASSATRLRPQGAGSSPSSIYSPIAGIPAAQTQVVREIPKHYLCLYPVYFDRRRTRAEGRQVGMEHAVDNPLARDIVDAVQVLGLRVGFEPDKTHPKDWANPGRVRVLLRDENGRALGGNAAKNKRHLFIKVGKYLKEHPATEESPFRLRIRGLPTPDKPLPPPAVPRGWKMGTILPLHSAGVTGGGVSENLLKEAMAEMQQSGGMPGMPGMPGMSGASAAGGGKVEGKKKGKE